MDKVCLSELVVYRSIQRNVPQSEGADDPDADLHRRLRGYFKKHPRWGWKENYHDCRLQGWGFNDKKIQRLWQQGHRWHASPHISMSEDRERPESTA
jgi:hypothetical protein